jgi:hypothetical protein
MTGKERDPEWQGDDSFGAGWGNQTTHEPRIDDGVAGEDFGAGARAGSSAPSAAPIQMRRNRRRPAFDSLRHSADGTGKTQGETHDRQPRLAFDVAPAGAPDP